MDKKTILISYQAMMMGGSTTSLLGLLNNIDYDKYEIDLLLNTNTGELLDKIPQQVNLLPPAFKYPNHKLRKIRSLFSPKYMIAYLKGRKYSKASGNIMHGVQYLETQDVIHFRKIDKKYDVAIAYLEGINCKFVAKHIKANKKIAWVHVDYEATGFNPDFDIVAMSHFQHIVTVSSKCEESFKRSFPQLSQKVISIDNMLSPEYIRNMAEDPIEFEVNNDYINLVTACRVEFQAKALDRAVTLFGKLKKDSKLTRLRWYIIGDGKDFESLKKLIQTENLENEIYLLGRQINPYPYIKAMDLFFLPSRFEGKPMVITEAQILGIPALVTNYSSADNQIDSGITGLIVDNNDNGIQKGLEYIINHPENINSWKHNVLHKTYSMEKSMNQIITIIND